MEKIEITIENEGKIRNELRSIKASNEKSNWFVTLIHEKDFDEISPDEHPSQLKVFKGEFQLLEMLNNYAIGIGYIGNSSGTYGLVPTPHILYINSDLNNYFEL